MERTLSIVKTDAVGHNHIGKIIAHLEGHDLRIAGLRMIHLNKKEAEGFYKEHDGKPFFKELVNFMTEGPIVVMAVEGENAIKRVRELMGATDPAKAAEGTIRKLYATSHTKNAIHGSDSPTSAEREISYFFKRTDLHERYLDSAHEGHRHAI